MIRLNIGDKYEYLCACVSGSTFGHFFVSEVINGDAGIYKITEIGISPREYIFEIDDGADNTEDIVYGKKHWEFEKDKYIKKIKS